MSANNIISGLVNSQVPFFVRNDHQTFVTFIQKYYEFLEQSEGLLDIKENLLSYGDIDYVSRKKAVDAGSFYYPVANPYYEADTYYRPYLRSNDDDITNNQYDNTVGRIGVIRMVSYMATPIPRSTFTGVDLNLYDYLATGGTGTYLSGSYADLNGTGVGVTNLDQSLWDGYFNDLPNGTGTPTLTTKADGIIRPMIDIQRDNPGYFSNDLFYNVVTTWSAQDGPSALETIIKEKLYANYLKAFPKDMQIDKAMLLKHAKEFYLTKGTERSIKFLMKIMFGEENVDIYYPKNDVIKASDGKWYIQRTLRVNDTKIDGVANNDINGIQSYVRRIITGVTSGAVATAESVDRFYEKGTQIDEITLSNIRGTFRNGEQVTAVFNHEGESTLKTITSNIYSGILNSVSITNPGTGYSLGDHPTITSSTGSGGDIQISAITGGNISSITVIDGGAGFRANDYLLFSVAPGQTGSGANGQLTLVLADNSTHPNSYNICFHTIDRETNTPIGSASYANLVFTVSDPANNWIQNSLSFFAYSNTGPARIIRINSAGADYSQLPDISILANNRVRELGILGRMTIYNGGSGYANGDTIVITNVSGGYGYGGLGNVKSINATGAITGVEFKGIKGHIVGGAGYSIDALPTASVTSAGGVGANIAVTGILGEGGSFISTNSTIGGIETISILTRGSGYEDGNTFINLTTLGDGTAQASISVVEGVYEYPGRYLNDDGMPSSYNFLQDLDYYQNFSYVVRVPQSIEKYRKTIKELAHPAGLKLFGQYMLESTSNAANSVLSATDSLRSTIKLKNYVKTGNTININYPAHGQIVGNTVYLGFANSYTANSTVDGIYRVTKAGTANNFEAIEPRSAVANVRIINPGLGYSNANAFITFSNEGYGAANATYTTNANGAIMSVTISDYGKYYTTRPTATVDKTATYLATLFVDLIHYANNGNGTVNVTFGRA
jgi:hypothetical protein